MPYFKEVMDICLTCNIINDFEFMLLYGMHRTERNGMYGTEHLIFIHICGIKIQNKVFLHCVRKFNQVISKMPFRVEK